MNGIITERIQPLPWPPSPVEFAGGFAAPPLPAEGVVMWNINTACNYRCSYCTQRFLEDRARWAQDTAAFLRGFRQLPGRWEIKLSGGEPFQHPTLLEIVSGLRELGHSISVVTNFSAAPEKLQAFLQAADTALRVFSASLHLEYVREPNDLQAFIDKGQMVQANLPAPGTFNVTCVATKHKLPRLAELAERFAAEGLRFKVQPEKQSRDIIHYTAEEQAELLRLGGHNGSGEVAWNFAGRPCWSGARAFTLDDRGQAWRCYPARRYRAQYLGNLLDGSFRLAPGPSLCLYAYCNCTVPLERGMMPRTRNDNEGESHEI